MTEVGYHPSCYDNYCSDNCCNYYGYCPSDYSYYYYDSYYTSCYYYYDNSYDYYYTPVGGIVGGSVGGFVGLFIIIALIVYFVKRRGAQQIAQAPVNADASNHTLVISGQGTFQQPYIPQAPPSYGYNQGQGPIIIKNAWSIETSTFLTSYSFICLFSLTFSQVFPPQ